MQWSFDNHASQLTRTLIMKTSRQRKLWLFTQSCFKMFVSAFLKVFSLSWQIRQVTVSRPLLLSEFNSFFWRFQGRTEILLLIPKAAWHLLAK